MESEQSGNIAYIYYIMKTFTTHVYIHYTAVTILDKSILIALKKFTNESEIEFKISLVDK